MHMELSPENPSIRYIKVMHLEQMVNLFRMDGALSTIEEHVERVEAAWKEQDPHITVHIVEGEEAENYERKFLNRACIPWSEASTKFPGFQYMFNWN